MGTSNISNITEGVKGDKEKRERKERLKKREQDNDKDKKKEETTKVKKRREISKILHPKLQNKKDVTKMKESELRHLARYTDDYKSEIIDVIRSKNNLSDDTVTGIYKQIEEKIGVIQENEEAEISAFLNGGLRNKKQISSIVSAIPPEKMLTYISTTQEKKRYLKALEGMKPKSTEAFLWAQYLEGNPFVLHSSKLNASEKKRILNIASNIPKQGLQGVLNNMKNILFFNFSNAALAQTYEENEKISAREEKMRKKVLTLNKFGENALKNIDKERPSGLSEEESLRYFVMAFQNEGMRKLRHKSVNESLEEFHYLLTGFQGVLKYILKLCPSLSEKENKSIMQEIYDTFTIPTEYIELLQSGKKQKLAAFLKKHNAKNFSAEDVQTMEEEITTIEKNAKREKLLESFTLATHSYSQAIRALYDFRDQYDFDFDDNINMNDVMGSQAAQTLYSKLKGLNMTLAKPVSDTIIKFLKTGDIPPATAFSRCRRLQARYSPDGNKLSNDEFNEIVDNPSSLEYSLPPSIVQSLLKSKPLDATKNAYNIDIQHKALQGMVSVVGKSEFNIIERIAPHMGKGIKANTEEVYKERVDSLPKSLENTKELAKKLVDIFERSKVSFDEEKSKAAYRGMFLQLADATQSPDDLKKFQQNIAGLAKQENGLESIYEALSPDTTHTIENIENILQKYLENFSGIEGASGEQLGQKVEHLMRSERTPITEVAYSSEEVQFLRTKNFLDDQKGIGIIISQILSGEKKITPEELQRLLLLENPNGDLFIQKFSNLSFVDQQNALQGKQEFTKPAAAKGENFIILPDDRYERLEEFSTKEFLNEQDVQTIKHETSHLIYPFAEEEFVNAVGNDFFERLSSGSGVYINGQIKTLEWKGKDAAYAKEEIFAHFYEGQPYPEELEEILHHIEEKISPTRKKEIFDTAYTAYKNYLKGGNSKNILNGAALAEQNTDGATVSTHTEGVEGESPKEILDSNARETYLRKFTGVEKEMYETLKDFRKFKGKLPGEQQKRLEAWDESFQDKLAQDRNKLAYGAIDIGEAEKIFDAYTLEGTQEDPRNKINTMMAKLSDSLVGEQSALKQAWDGTQLLSMSDIGSIWTTTWEYIKRRHESKSKRRVGNAGKSMFSGIANGLASDFDKEQESAEQSEVNDIQEALKNKNTPQIYDFLESAGASKDHAKAAIQELAERGQVDWNDDRVWKSFQKLGSGIDFYGSDFKNLAVRDSKYQKAFTRIWGDEDMFQELVSKNDSNITSNVDKFFSESASKLNVLTQNLDQWIRDKRRGVFIDPHQYEGYINQLKVGGKGNPASPVYYLIIGVAEGIITPETATRFDAKYLNDYPLSQLFDNTPGKEEFERWEKEILYNSETNSFRSPDQGVPPNFRNWVDKELFTKPAVIERTLANQGSPKNMDHDHARLLLSVGDAENVKGMISQSSTGIQQFKPTMYSNITVGMLEYSASMAAQEETIPKEVLRQNFIRHAGYIASFDGMTGGRTDPATRQRFKFTSSSLNAKPRERGGYNSDMNTRDFLAANRAVFTNIKEGMFKDFLTHIAFNTNASVIGEKYESGMKDEWDMLKSKWGPEWGQFEKFLENEGGGYVGPDKKGETLHTHVMPAAMEYFLSKDRRQDEYLENILENSRNISSGKTKKEWANNSDPDNIYLTQKQKEDLMPPPQYPDSSVSDKVLLGQDFRDAA